MKCPVLSFGSSRVRRCPSEIWSGGGSQPWISGSRRATEGERWCDGQRKGGERLGERAVASEANISKEKHCVFVADVPTDVYKHAGFYKNASADTSEDVGRH